MRILLIGGNGFIGSPLTEQLLGAGHEVAIFHRGAGQVSPAATVLHIQGDRKQLFAYVDPVRKFSPEVIVDLILSSGEQARQLMEFARGIVSRVVALSSGDVYRAWGVFQKVEAGELEPLPITEDSARRTTRQLYSPEGIRMLQSVFTWVSEDYDKIAVEDAVMNSSHVSGTVLRLPMVYGPGDPLHRFFPVLKRISDGRRFIPLPDDVAAWRGPRGYVENVAHAIALAATEAKAAGKIYNVCEEPCVSELEWQKKIASQTGWTGEFAVWPAARTPKHLLFPGNATQHVVISSERIRTELGYSEIVRQDEGIRRTIAWEQSHPPDIDPQKFDYAAEDAALAGP